MTQPRVTLNDGRRIPQLGFGVWKLADETVPALVGIALEAGYRSIDTAAAYGNEAGVGRAIAASGLAREDVFVTTKLWNDGHGFEAALRAFDASLQRLGLDYVDLYLVHWPVPRQDAYVETWRALMRLREEGRARSIGVSNFTAAQLTRLIDETGSTPSVNQIELHPGFQQRAAQAYHADKGIVTQSWSPLGQGRTLRDERIGRIAGRLGTSAAQVIIAWHLAKGLAVIPKAGDLDHLADNWAARDVELTDEDVATIDAMDDADGRIGPDPLRF